METLSELAEATIELFDLHVWFLITGILIAAWLCLRIITKRRTILSTALGLVIGIFLLWLGFISIYYYSSEFAIALSISWVTIPIALFIGIIVVCLILSADNNRRE